MIGVRILGIQEDSSGEASEDAADKPMAPDFCSSTFLPLRNPLCKLCQIVAPPRLGDDVRCRYLSRPNKLVVWRASNITG